MTTTFKSQFKLIMKNTFADMAKYEDERLNYVAVEESVWYTEAYFKYDITTQLS